MRTLISLLCLCLLTLACEKEDVTIFSVPQDQVALELHAIVACGGEFDRGDESAEEWAQRVVDAVSTAGLSIINFTVEFQEVENPGFCGNCAPTGDILKVTAPREQEEELLALGFR